MMTLELFLLLFCLIGSAFFAGIETGIISINRLRLQHFVRRQVKGAATIRHFLSKDEVLRILLKQALNLFVAPERAKYYFVPQIDTKIKVSGCRSVSVYEGMELFIVSRMKREMPLYYTGPDGLIYTVYFEHNENVDAGSPLIGVCPPDQLQQIEEVVLKVQTEWQEQE